MGEGELPLPQLKQSLTAIQKLVNYKKLSIVLRDIFTSSKPGGTRGFFRHNRWVFSKKAKGLIVFAIITVMLISVFAFLPKQSESKFILPTPDNSTATTESPTPNPTISPHSSSIPSSVNGIGRTVVDNPQIPRAPGDLASAQSINSTLWRKIAANAWKYFQPDIGVDSITGIPSAAWGSPDITDWDLGVYIQAVIDAQKIGLINADGDWGANARIDKVLTFLETRELNNYSYPYWFYQSFDGKPDHKLSDSATTPFDGVDTGRLFVALNNLKINNANLTSRINNIVYNNNVVVDNKIVNITSGQGNRSNYAAIVPDIKTDSLYSTSIYAYYIYSGFASFWPKDLSDVPSKILNNIFSAGNITTPEGVSLPKSTITGDPLYCSIFELNNNDSKLMTLAHQVYLAHEAYYNATLQGTDEGKYRAFSEGPSLAAGWVYEWVVLPNGQTWTLDAANSNSSPVIYTKIALSFLALYNTTYAKNMSIYLENTLPDPSQCGHCEGVDESGMELAKVGSNTNSLILDAALYAIQNYP
jgi:hypothetical protein